MMMIMVMLLLWVALVALSVWGISWLFPTWHATKDQRLDDGDPMKRLALRYIRGEITSEQYQLLRQGLREHGDGRETRMLSEPLNEGAAEPQQEESCDRPKERRQDGDS